MGYYNKRGSTWDCLAVKKRKTYPCFFFMFIFITIVAHLISFGKTNQTSTLWRSLIGLKYIQDSRPRIKSEDARTLNM